MGSSCSHRTLLCLPVTLHPWVNVKTSGIFTEGGQGLRATSIEPSLQGKVSSCSPPAGDLGPLSLYFQGPPRQQDPSGVQHTAPVLRTVPSLLSPPSQAPSYLLSPAGSLSLPCFFQEGSPQQPATAPFAASPAGVPNCLLHHSWGS